MAESRQVVLGIDGGGTTTRAAIASPDGRVLGTGEGGASNYQAIGMERAVAGIRTAVDHACAAAGASVTPAAAFLAIAGVVSPTDRALLRRAVDGLELAPRVAVDHDLSAALAGGLGGEPGIVLIAGTGSSCYGRRSDGEDWRAGGWGHLLDDDGGGYRIGLDALRAAVRAVDGRGPDTELRSRAIRAIDVDDPDEILHAVHNRLQRSDIAALAPLVFASAAENDAVASTIVERGARALAAMVRAVAERLAFEDVRVVTSGGLFTNLDYRERVRREVARHVPGALLVRPQRPPVEGACLLAAWLLSDH